MRPAPLAVDAARSALARAREEIRAGHEPGRPRPARSGELEAAAEPRLRRVLNATGVIVHTNLGRAPLAGSALARAVEVGGSYSNLEYDLALRARAARARTISRARCAG